MVRRIALGVALLLVLGVGWLLTTDNDRIWPYRNALRYYLLVGDRGSRPIEYEAPPTLPPSGLQTSPDTPRGTLSGTVRTPTGQPITGATVLVAEADGTPHAGESDNAGRYAIENVPVGSYIPVAGAPGYADTSVRTWLGVGVAANTATQLDITLKPAAPSRVTPAGNVRLSEGQVWQIEKPLPARAVRRELTFRADGRPNQLTLYYTPDDGQDTILPTLLAVYPGPANEWESVSLPLAQAGYAVIAVGPEYALDLEQDIDDLERVVNLVKQGAFPRADRERIGALAGSYSGLHVMRLAVRNPAALDAALLLGPPTDAFELRRQFEAGSFFPPFGLDQALVALGLPNREPERYWRYSVRYHARAIQMPVMLIHSKQDEIVPFTQSQMLADEFQRLGTPYELHILEGLGHYLLETERTPAIDDLFNTTTEFFAQNLR